MIFGNGGSAAIASHFSVDLTKNSKIRCVNFNESSLLTCFSNDYGYENWIKKVLEFYANPKDLIILISASKQSLEIHSLIVMPNLPQFLNKIVLVD